MGDIGAWAVLAFDHPTVLVGQDFAVASDCLTGAELAAAATRPAAFGPGVSFEYKQQPSIIFEALAYLVPSLVYIGGIQRWYCGGGVFDLCTSDVEVLRTLHVGTTFEEHLRHCGLEQKVQIV